MKSTFNLKGITKHKLSTTISAIMLVAVGYQYATGKLPLSEFITQIEVIAQLVGSIVALLYNTEQPEKVNTGIPSKKP